VVQPEAGSFLSGLAPEEVEALRSAGTVRRHRRQATLFSEGDRSESVVLLLAGRVKIVSSTADGREVVLGLRGPGDLLGELSAVDGERRSASAIALEPVEALSMARTTFRQLLETRPALSIALLELLAGRLRDADRKRAEYAAHDALGRVARRLSELADRYGERTPDGVSIGIALSQDELAGWTGASREAVTRALRSLRARGLITTSRRAVVVVDPDALRRAAT
jgi:CRP/FNR family transcriptional regulator, cyclic AMP receptor protein